MNIFIYVYILCFFAHTYRYIYIYIYTVYRYTHINTVGGKKILHHQGCPKTKFLGLVIFKSFGASPSGAGVCQPYVSTFAMTMNDRWIQEFDVVHSVVALHRIAKSTDYRELRSSNKLREQLASLASNAADAVS